MKHKRNAILRIAGIVALVAIIGFSIAGCENGANGTITSDSSVSTPTASPPAGTYATAQNVLLACATAGAEIYYTVDGSTPSANSTPYAGLPITVSSNMTIRAIAIKAGWTNSGILTAGYVISGGGGVTPPVAGLTAPILTVTNVTSSEIHLEWTAVTGAAGYRIYASASASSGFILQGTVQTTAEYIYGIPPGATRYYYVAAYNASGEGPHSNTVSATTQGGGTPGGATDKLSFTPINGGMAYAVSALNDSIIGDVVIPSTYQGMPVTEILNWQVNRKGAFQGCRYITSVIIPNSVTVIGRGAFYGCSNINTVTIGSGVVVIEQDAFYGCSSLASVTFLGRVSNIHTNGALPGDLRVKYTTNGPGTYTRPNGTGSTWNKN